MKRTESDKLAQADIEVILGGEKYSIPPLVIRDSRIWRQKVVTIMARLPEYLEGKSELSQPVKGFMPWLKGLVGRRPSDSVNFEEALKSILITMPDTTLDLFFEYAKGLDRAKIEKKANEFEIAEAFSLVVEVAFPLARSLPKAMGRLSQ